MWPKPAIAAAAFGAAWLGFVGYLNVTSGEWEPRTAEEQLEESCQRARDAGMMDSGGRQVPADITAEERLAAIDERRASLAKLDKNISRAGALDTALLEENPQWFDRKRLLREEIAALCRKVWFAP